MRGRRSTLVTVAAALVLGACSATTSPAEPSSAPAATGSPAVHDPGHVVVVMFENHSYSDVIGNRSAPYVNALARHGTDLTRMYAITHPSQPNYVALFSGGPRGVTGDACPQHLRGQNLASQLRAHGRTFAGFSEGLPRTGSGVCRAGAYVRRHAPWTNFAALPATSTHRRFASFPTTGAGFARLPSVSFVIPDLEHDMHDGTVAQGDRWLRTHLAAYATWARSHRSLLVVTWDEDDHSESNRIPTVVTGAGVRAHRVTTRTTLYSVLRLIEDRYRLPRLGGAAGAPRISLT